MGNFKFQKIKHLKLEKIKFIKINKIKKIYEFKKNFSN